MKGIIASYIFFKVRCSAALHSCVLPGQWPPLLSVCCKSIWLLDCPPLLWTTAHGIVEPLRCVCIRVMTESRGAQQRLREGGGTGGGCS